uniref:Hypotheticial protein n=1 Tax=Schistosoma japonicum TaxID=6182 RepID=C1LE15_SCHJA|nr:hypotheticial protein [Schistosoma japonicum]
MLLTGILYVSGFKNSSFGYYDGASTLKRSTLIYFSFKYHKKSPSTI